MRLRRLRFNRLPGWRPPAAHGARARLRLPRARGGTPGPISRHLLDIARSCAPAVSPRSGRRQPAMAHRSQLEGRLMRSRLQRAAPRTDAGARPGGRPRLRARLVPSRPSSRGRWRAPRSRTRTADGRGAQRRRIRSSPKPIESRPGRRADNAHAETGSIQGVARGAAGRSGRHPCRRAGARRRRGSRRRHESPACRSESRRRDAIGRNLASSSRAESRGGPAEWRRGGRRRAHESREARRLGSDRTRTRRRAHAGSAAGRRAV